MLQSCYKTKGQPEKLCFSSNNSIKTFSDNAKKIFYAHYPAFII